MKHNLYFTGLLLIVAGLLCLAYGIYLPFQSQSEIAQENSVIIENGIITTGEVVSIRKTMQSKPGANPPSDTSVTLYEIADVKYSVDGKIFSISGERPVDTNGWEKGSPIKVIYKIEDPRIAVVAENGVEGVNSHPYLPAAFLISGIFLTSGGILFRLKYQP